MFIHSLSLKNFRRFSEQKFFFHPMTNIILAPNSFGKTTVLEAIYLSLTGSGFRESKEEEFIRLGKEKASIQLIFKEELSKDLLQIEISKKKEVFLNKNKTTFKEIYQKLPRPVLFTPQDINILTGPPDERRRYLNKLLANNDYKYKSILINYEQALRKRNKILQQAETIAQIKDEIKFWDEYLEKQDQEIFKYRKKFFAYASEHNRFFDYEFRISYHQNRFKKLSDQPLQDQEIKYGYTLSGAHREDFSIQIKNKQAFLDVKRFGSRSEQRLAILWLKKIETNFLTNNYKPILLIDDIFSELDLKNRKMIIKFFSLYQTILTTTSPLNLQLIDIPYHQLTL